MTAVPLLAKPDGPSPAASDSCGEAGCGCSSDSAADEPAIACTLDADHMGTRIDD